MTERNAFWDMESDFGGGGPAEIESKPGMDALIAEIRQAAGLKPRQKAEKPIVPCPKCNGTGRWFRGLECFKCSGTGKVKGLLQDEASVKRRQKAAERRSGQTAPTPAPQLSRLPMALSAGRTGMVVLAGREILGKAFGGRVWVLPHLPPEVKAEVTEMLKSC
ncbi:MAG: hypothetical protein ACO3AD_18920 [Burkholderiaceae bacterium]